jgi:hypothetical protein
MSKFLLNLLLQIFQSLSKFKNPILIRRFFFLTFGPADFAAHSAFGSAGPATTSTRPWPVGRPKPPSPPPRPSWPACPVRPRPRWNTCPCYENIIPGKPPSSSSSLSGYRCHRPFFRCHRHARAPGPPRPPDLKTPSLLH